MPDIWALKSLVPTAQQAAGRRGGLEHRPAGPALPNYDPHHSSDHWLVGYPGSAGIRDYGTMPCNFSKVCQVAERPLPELVTWRDE